MAQGEDPVRHLYLAAFLAAILAANWVTTTHGLIPVGFGLMATAGTYLAGLTFVIRDSLQDTGGTRWTFAGIIAGAVLSFAIADPFIALASGVAFLCSETADWCVYSPLRGKGYGRAAVASNVVGSVVDTLLFLSIAGFGLDRSIVAGQIVGKLTVTAAVVLAVAASRHRFSHDIDAYAGSAVRLTGGLWDVPVTCRRCKWTHNAVTENLQPSTIEAAAQRMADLHKRTRTA